MVEYTDVYLAGLRKWSSIRSYTQWFLESGRVYVRILGRFLESSRVYVHILSGFEKVPEYTDVYSTTFQKPAEYTDVYSWVRA